VGLNPIYYLPDPTHSERLQMIEQGTRSEKRWYTFSYNSDGFLQQVTNYPLNQSVAFSGYDGAGRVGVLTLPDNRDLRFTYDSDGHLYTITPPDRPVHTFTYYPTGKMESYTAPAVAGTTNTTTWYNYNDDGQLDHITYPDTQVTTFGYDRDTGRLNSITTPSGQLSYTYDSSTGNLSTITAPGGITLSYSFDGALLTSETWAGSITGSVSYTYYDDFRLHTHTVNGGNPVAFQYDEDGLLRQAGDLVMNRHPQHGLVTDTQLGSIQDSRGYNNFGELASYTATFAPESSPTPPTPLTLYDCQYTLRDGLGRISEMKETIGGETTTFNYDYHPCGFLKEVKKNGVVVASYDYNGPGYGNRWSSTDVNGTKQAVYDDQDRLLSYGSTTYTYTPNGEVRTKTVNGQKTTYQYDLLGNLLSVDLPDSKSIIYLIDGRNRRVGKLVNGTLQQGFLYQPERRSSLLAPKSGNDIAKGIIDGNLSEQRDSLLPRYALYQEGLRPIAELDASNNMVSHFIYGSRANVPDYMIRVKEGAIYRILTDQLGSPRLVVNIDTGQIVQQMDYDAFGNVTSDTNPGLQPFGFAGGLYDHETGLVRFGARDYDPETGRWTAKDPLGFKGGSTNLYGYVQVDPINAIDQTGLGVEFDECINEAEDKYQSCLAGVGYGWVPARSRRSFCMENVYAPALAACYYEEAARQAKAHPLQAIAIACALAALLAMLAGFIAGQVGGKLIFAL
jgi:RHS repeat-associated protein